MRASLFLIFLGSCAIGSAQLPRDYFTSRYQYDNRARAANSYEAVPSEWAKENWTSEGAQRYASLRLAIDSLIASKAASPELSRLAKEAHQAPKSSERQFKWVYAFYKANVLTGSVSVDIGKAMPFRLALADIPDARNQEVMRLRYLLEGRYFPRQDPALISLGKRLLVKFPNDDSVSFAVAQFLMRSTSLNDKSAAVLICSKLVQTRGDRPGRWLALGNAYMFRYFATNKKADAEQAIGVFDKYLGMLPSGQKVSAVKRSRDRLAKELGQ